LIFLWTNLKTKEKIAEEAESKPSIFALNHWRVEISTHWPNLASAILFWQGQFRSDCSDDFQKVCIYFDIVLTLFSLFTFLQCIKKNNCTKNMSQLQEKNTYTLWEMFFNLISPFWLVASKLSLPKWIK
jgi:hypothetical protein